MEAFTCSPSLKVLEMPDYSYKGCFEDPKQQFSPANGNQDADDDLVMERILESISTTPLGQVLRRIASLPEVRQDKVLDVRQQLTEGKYQLNERLDAALERVLDDLCP
jgi:hypothetical protein